MNEGEEKTSTFKDVSKAFDIVNYDIIRRKNL